MKELVGHKTNCRVPLALPVPSRGKSGLTASRMAKPVAAKRTNRAGYALMLFVMIFVGLMGLAALVIDMGFTRLAQRQMQTAVDSAALEGLRGGTPLQRTRDSRRTRSLLTFSPTTWTVAEQCITARGPWWISAVALVPPTWPQGKPCR